MHIASVQCNDFSQSYHIASPQVEKENITKNPEAHLCPTPTLREGTSLTFNSIGPLGLFLRFIKMEPIQQVLLYLASFANSTFMSSVHVVVYITFLKIDSEGQKLHLHKATKDSSSSPKRWHNRVSYAEQDPPDTGAAHETSCKAELPASSARPHNPPLPSIHLVPKCLAISLLVPWSTFYPVVHTLLWVPQILSFS